MARPFLMSKQDWLIATTVTKWHGQSDKVRSQALQNIDLYLDEYHTNAQWPQMLRQLEVTLEAWVRSKTKPDGQLNTIRSHTRVQLLQQQVKAARALPDPLPWDDHYPGIYIAQDPFAGDFAVPDDFSTEVKRDLEKLVSKTRGEQLVKSISDGCTEKAHRVVIQYNKGAGGNQCAPVNVAITNDFRRRLCEFGAVDLGALLSNPQLVATGIAKVGEAPPRFIPNTGANVVVKYNHKDPGEAARESFVGLAHELVHAFHFVYGLCARAPTGGAMGDHGGAEEEMRTVGALAYKDEVPSENWIRAEWDMPRRTSYSGNDFGDTTATLFK
jgi:hypothetical protein